MPINHYTEIIPPIHEWAFHPNKWLSNGSVLFQQDPRKKLLLESPQFELPGGVFYTIILEYEGMRYSNTEFLLLESKTNRVIKRKEQKGWGVCVCSLGFFGTTHNAYKLRFYSRPPNGKNAFFRNPKVSLLSFQPFDARLPQQDTALEHWGFFKKWLHGLCKKSRHLNIAVAFIEMHMGKTELVSLPSFVALCPTGQCNAKCVFCSVSENRSGIRKTAIPESTLEKLILQIGASAWMFGIEGNGEPLLYKKIDQLIATIFSKNAMAYFISNGSLLTDRLIYLLSTDQIDSINFSINAATEKTHSRIMGLGNLAHIQQNIRKIVHCRGNLTSPALSISLVVTSLNVHEVIDFIVLAESLGVDRVYIRPLSEIANSEGTIEDIRSIVPFEFDIYNLKEEIKDFLHDNAPKIDIVFDYKSFKAVKTTPLDVLQALYRHNNHLIPPNRRYWHFNHNDLSLKWESNKATLTWLNQTGSDCYCDPIPVKKNVQLMLKFRLSVEKGAIVISINGSDGVSLENKRYYGNDNADNLWQEMTIQTGENDWVDISIHGVNRSRAIIEFERVRSYPKQLNRDELLTDSNKWERGCGRRHCHFVGNRLKINYEGKKYVYLIKSYGIPCIDNESIQLSATITVRQGELAIGALSADGLNWIKTFDFPQGIYEDVLQFDSGANDRFHIVLFSNSDQNLIAEVQWKGFGSVATPSARTLMPGNTEPSERKKELWQNEHHSDAERAGEGCLMASKNQSFTNLFQRFRKIRTFNLKWIFQKYNRVYCQKPWTDLSNFTVDGRMDVCCIATGESQKEYALGYLSQNRFQDIWNGPMAQKFRRTVNRQEHRLPPCSRCPMAYQQQGLLFSLGFTKEYLKNFIILITRQKAPMLLKAILMLMKDVPGKINQLAGPESNPKTGSSSRIRHSNQKL